MKHIALALFLAAAFSTSRAGEIYGTLAEGTKPLAAGTKLEITAGDKSYGGETDKFGAYRVFVKEKGKCTLKVHIKDQTATFDVISFEKSTRYDLVLEGKNGTYTLRRK